MTMFINRFVFCLSMELEEFERKVLDDYFTHHFTFVDAKQSYQGLQPGDYDVLEERTKQIIYADNKRFAHERAVKSYLQADSHDYYFEKKP